MNGLKMKNRSKERHVNNAILGAAAALFFGVFGTLACSDAEGPGSLDVSSSVDHSVEVGPCEPGAERACGVTLEQANGIVTCFEGTQTCDAGVWGECQGERVVKRPDPTSQRYADHYRALALSVPAVCVGNACDPSCQYFDEDPPDFTIGAGGAGIGLGGAPNWSEPPGTAACGHELCTAGVALDPTCHPCVEKVCNSSGLGYCCDTSTGTWDAACTDAVYTECASTTPPSSSTPSICDFALYTESNLALADRAQIVGAPVGARRDGGTGYAVDLGNAAAGQYIEEIIANGPIDIQGTPVLGSCTTSSMTIDKSASAACGSETYGATVSMPDIPTKSISCLPVGGGVNINSGTVTAYSGDNQHYLLSSTSTLILAEPGDYGDVVMSDGTLILQQPGTYTFTQLRLDGSSPKLIIPDNGTVKIDVCTDLNFDNGAIIQKANGDEPDLYQVQFYTDDAWVKIGVGALLNTVIVAPNATITGGNSSSIAKGLIYAEAIALEPDFHLDASWLDRDECLAAGVDSSVCGGYRSWELGRVYQQGDVVKASNGKLYECAGAPLWASAAAWCGLSGYEPTVGVSWPTAWVEAGDCPTTSAPSCPVDLDVPATPSASEPCYDGGDCQVNSRCTEVLTGGTCEHSKCSTGTALDPACDDCVSRICGVDPTCCGQSGGTWTSACVDLVKTECDAFCGSGVETGTCVDNGTSFSDPTCASADLAVDISCADDIPVCNHGTVDVAAGDAVLTFYPRVGQQFATETPDPFWAVGTCTVAQAIPAGSCVTVSSCDPALLSEDLTVVVNASDSAAINECSLLDNWSYYVEGRTCSAPAAGPSTVTHEYEATCPADTNPSWGLLSWETQTPGASTIDFKARVAASSAELSSASFTTVGTAYVDSSVTPVVDTQSCPRSGTVANCPVDLTKELMLAGNQPAFLELEITLNPDGSNAPTVEDWQITYSCVYDQ